MTLDEAVASLEAMEDPEAVLATYPNRMGGNYTARCSSCPIAQYLKHETGQTWWVTPEANIMNTNKDGWSYGLPVASLSKRFVSIIDKFDRMQA